MIDDRIHKRGEKKVYVAHCDVDHLRSMFTKSMDKCQTNYSDIENQDTADVGDTRVEGLGPFFSRSNAHDSLENQNVGKKDDEKVQQDH